MKKRTSDAAKLRTYIAALPPAARRHLKAIRGEIRKVAPKAEEVISYGIPAFKVEGRVLVWYAGWKAHCSIYPFSARELEAAGIDPKKFKTSRGTVQLPLDKPVPVTLVRKLVRARLATLRKPGH